MASQQVWQNTIDTLIDTSDQTYIGNISYLNQLNFQKQISREEIKAWNHHISPKNDNNFQLQTISFHRKKYNKSVLYKPEHFSFEGKPKLQMKYPKSSDKKYRINKNKTKNDEKKIEQQELHKIDICLQAQPPQEKVKNRNHIKQLDFIKACNITGYNFIPSSINQTARFQIRQVRKNAKTHLSSVSKHERSRSYSSEKKEQLFEYAFMSYPLNIQLPEAKNQYSTKTNFGCFYPTKKIYNKH